MTYRNQLADDAGHYDYEVEDEWDVAHRMNEEYDDAMVQFELDAEDRANRRIMCAGTN